MRHTVAALVCIPALAFADPADDGYCDYVQGTASAASATLRAPQIFGQFGYIEQPSFALTPGVATNDLRSLAGMRFSVTNLYAASATTQLATAECTRHRALLSVRGATSARAIAARVQIYDDAQKEADRILALTDADLDGRRATAQEAMAMRMRVEELRTLAANAHRDLAALPPPDQRPLGTLLASYYTADAAVEASEGKLRTIRAYDVSLRAGADRYLQGPSQDTRYFAVVELGINLGALWIGGGNKRAAAGRRKFVRSGNDPLGSDAPLVQLQQTIDLEDRRLVQTAALVGDLERQMEVLAKLATDDSERFRRTIWFDWVKAKAELAYLQAHVTALREAIGSDAR